MSARRLSLALALALTAAALPAGLTAQATTTPGITPEIRADLTFGPRAAIQGGAGLQVPFGYYLRLGVDAALGVRTGSVDGARMDGRVDVLGRFLLDPFRQGAVGFSAGAGLGARFEHGERVTPLLLVALEVEGRRRASGWVPALQLGLGGGARLGVVLRRGAEGMR